MEPNNPKIQPTPDVEMKRKLIKLMRRVRRRSILREMIDVDTGEVKNTPENVTALLDILKNASEYYWRERRIAAIALGTVAVENEQALLVASILGQVVLGTDIRPTQRLTQRSLLAALRTGLWVCFWACLIFPCFAAWYHGPHTPAPVMFAMELISLMIAASFPIFTLSPVLDVNRNEVSRKEALKSLAYLAIPQSVGVFAVIAKRGNKTGKLAKEALLRVIPKLTPEHYGQMPSDTTPQLCAFLNSLEFTSVVQPYRSALLRSLLDALEMVGDGRAVKTLKHCMGWVKNEELKSRVAEVGLLLVARREQEENSNILLRGSAPPPTMPAELLRAASYSATSEPEQLLRAGIGPSKDPEQTG